MYTLNGVQIAAPAGIDGLRLARQRHKGYWGFFLRGEAMVTGLTNLVFTDPNAVRILEAGFKQLLPKTLFAINLPGLSYEAQIDYDTYTRTLTGVTVGLKSNSVADTIARLANTVYELPIEESFSLLGLPIGDPVELMVPGSAFRVVVPRGVASGLPFTGAPDPSLPNVIYINTSTTPVLIRVKGRIEATLSGASSYQLSAGGVMLFSTGSTAVSNVSGLIDAKVTLSPGATLTALVTLGGSVGSISYDTATALTLTEWPEKPVSVATGIGLTSAVRALLDNMGLPDVAISSAWLSRYGSGKLATAAGLAGGTRQTMSLSLAGLLGNLCTLHYLRAGLTTDNIFTLESRGEGETVSTVPYRQIRSLSIKRATEYVYGSVVSGWPAPSDTAQRQTADYRERTYLTGALSGNELTLKPTWLCDPARIEQARRGLLSQNSDKTKEIYYVPASGDRLTATAIRERWASWYTYSQLPELHTLTVDADGGTYLTLSDSIDYDGPNGPVSGELLDAAYDETAHLLTITLLVR